MMWDDTFCLSKTCKHKDKCDRAQLIKGLNIFSTCDFTEECLKGKKRFVPLPKKRKLKGER